MHVVDASVVVAFFIGEDAEAQAASRVLAPDADLWAPHLLDAEVGHALRKAVRANMVTEPIAAASLEDLRELPLQRVPHVGLIEAAWSLRDNVSFYDAIYVSLAERLGIPLVTFDLRLGRAASGRVEVLDLGGEGLSGPG